MSNALWCKSCMLNFPLSRTNVRPAPMGVRCRICEGTGKIKDKNEQGQMEVVACPCCEGEGECYAVATCHNQVKSGYCLTQHPVPKKVADSLTWLGRPDPRVPQTTAALRERGVIPKHVRKGKKKRGGTAAWPER